MKLIIEITYIWDSFVYPRKFVNIPKQPFNNAYLIAKNKTHPSSNFLRFKTHDDTKH